MIFVYRDLAFLWDGIVGFVGFWGCSTEPARI